MRTGREYGMVSNHMNPLSCPHRLRENLGNPCKLDLIILLIGQHRGKRGRANLDQSFGVNENKENFSTSLFWRESVCDGVIERRVVPSSADLRICDLSSHISFVV